MKILKIFGIVVGIHVFALILIFANPGCSSTTKPTPALADTTSKTETANPLVSAPSTTSASASTSSAITFNPEAPAAASMPSTGGARVTPTRPGTPVAGVLVSEPVTGFTPAVSYTVKSGDNLWTIAKKNNTTVAQLTAANNLPAGANLRPGQKLIIPEKSGSASAGGTAMTAPGSTPKIIDTSTGTAARASADVVKHTVKSGETLGGIARKYEVRQGDIAVANNISDPAKIRPGMELIIPGWRPPSGKTGKTSTKSTANGSTKTTPPAAAANVEPTPSAPAEPAPTPLPPVPVIRLDDGPSK